MAVCETGDTATTDPLAALRAMVLADVPLQHRLGALIDPAEFIACMGDAAAQAGVAWDAAMVADLLRPDPLGLARWAPAPVNPPGWPGPGWLPSRSLAMGDAPTFDWVWQGDRPLDQPFYEDSMRQAGHRPLSQLLRARTTLDQLIAGWQGAAEPVDPAGFVFHLSRCGSTLLAAMLQSLPGCYAASEPEPFDAVIQWAWRASVGIDVKIAALRAVAATLGRQPPQPGARFFIKLDCWHTLSLPLLRAAFPDTPWLFLTRDPLEVAVSQLARPGVHVVPGMIGADMIGIADGEAMPPGGYCARVLGRILAAAGQHAALGGGLLVDYGDLVQAMPTSIAAHFAIPMDAAAHAQLTTLTARNAKAPAQAFAPDVAAKRAAASPELEALVDQWARPAYQQLEQLFRYDNRRR